MSLALARKYRPRNFASVAVQTHVSRTLRGAIARGRIAHGYLLCGPRGTGKTTLARVLAMALNCEKRLSGEIPDEGEPCGECTSCQRIWGGSASLDVVEIDAASNRGVDDARELRERAMYAPSSEARYKVYIIDEAHMLTREAWNALLKILEEPPPRVVFVFATTDPVKIVQSAAPVLSRLQRFDLKRIGAPEIRAKLSEILAAEKVPAATDAISMIARAADGSMRDALSLTDQVLSHSNGEISVDSVRESLGLVAEDEYLAVFDIIAGRDAKSVFPTVARLADAGIDFTAFLGGIADLLRALLATLLGSEALDISDRTRQALQQRKGDLTTGDVVRMLNMIGEVEPRFRKSSQQQLLLETLLVRFALIDRTVDLEQLISGFSGGAGGAGIPDGGGGQQKGRQSESRAGSERATPSRQESRPNTTSSPSTEKKVAAPRPSEIPQVDRAREKQETVVPQALDINRLAEHWDEVVERVRASGRAMLASHLALALPSAVSSRGVITVQLDENTPVSFDLVQEALNGAQAELLSALRVRFTGVEKVVLAPLTKTTSVAPMASRRLTAEAIKAERLDSLRKKDPVLDAAVRELDLELLD